MSTGGYGVTVARGASSVQAGFDSSRPLQLIFNLRSDIANAFRKRHISGFVRPGSCNAYAGVTVGREKELIGVFGVIVGTRTGAADILVKADTIRSDIPKGGQLMSFLLVSGPMWRWLEERFCIQKPTVMTACVSPYPSIARYRAAAERTKTKRRSDGMYSLVYRFDMGKFPTVKAARAEWLRRLS